MTQPADDLHRRERLSVLAAMEAALADPVRLIGEELRVLRADWGATVEAHAQFSGRRSAVVSIDGTERAFRGGGVQSVLERIEEFLLVHVALPRLRPVAVRITGLADGPIRMTCTPARTWSYEYPDEQVAPNDEG